MKVNLKRFFEPTLICFFLAALFAGCSTANQDSPLSLVDASGNHPDGWITAHRQYAPPDGSLCTECHGDDLAGGISGVSCYTASRNGLECHTNGPAYHPADWLNKTATGNTWHAGAYQSGFQVSGFDCVDCHDPLGSSYPGDVGKCTTCHFTIGGAKSPGGWTHPPPYNDNHSDFAGSPEETICVACHEVNNRFGHEPSCHNCHNVVIHEVEYLDHYLVAPTFSDFSSQCSNCHAITGTSPLSGAPVCVSCHVAGSPYLQTNCTSCHGRPPNTGEHGEHSGRATCDDCHQGSGSGSGLNHGYDGYVNGVDVAFPASININFNGSSCTGDCHGEGHNDSW